MKICSPSPVTRKMHIKIALTYLIRENFLMITQNTGKDMEKEIQGW